jgi:hypothetical protein
MKYLLPIFSFTLIASGAHAMNQGETQNKEDKVVIKIYGYAEPMRKPKKQKASIPGIVTKINGFDLDETFGKHTQLNPQDIEGKNPGEIWLGTALQYWKKIRTANSEQEVESITTAYHNNLKIMCSNNAEIAAEAQEYYAPATLIKGELVTMNELARQLQEKTKALSSHIQNRAAILQSVLKKMEPAEAVRKDMDLLQVSSGQQALVSLNQQ